MNEKKVSKKNKFPVKDRSLARLSTLQLYLREISKYPLLKPEEELELAKKHHDLGEIEAAHRLVTSNLRLVVKIANDFKQAQVELLDLIQEGSYGLMQAVKKFNPYKGVKLSSYAAWWIRAYILKYLMDNRSQVRIATTAAQKKLFYNLQKEVDRLLQEYDKVDPKLIAKRLDVSEGDVIEMQKRLGSSDISLDAPLGDDSQSSKLDMIVDEQSSGLEESLSKSQIEKIFSTHLEEFEKELFGRDLEIFQKRMRAENPLTLQEIGTMYGISRERARQIEARILTKLKKFVAEKGVL